MHPVETLKSANNILERMEGKDYCYERFETTREEIQNLLRIISLTVTDDEYRTRAYAAVVQDCNSLVNARFKQNESQKVKNNHFYDRIRQARLSIEYTIGLIEKATHY